LLEAEKTIVYVHSAEVHRARVLMILDIRHGGF
jgi:hypothetical protein